MLLVSAIILQILPNGSSIINDLLIITKINFVVASSHSHVIGLSKTGWVERYKAYENYYLLFKFLVITFDSICNPYSYKDFYKYLENETIENWC